MPENMKLIESFNLSYNIEIEGADSIRNLFSMTPYSYRTSERDMQKLMALEYLETEIEFDIFVYAKEDEI
jgi:23S rRNA (guanine745-N1)-methyltransferase